MSSPTPSDPCKRPIPDVNLYRAVFEQSLEAILILDDQFRIVDANPAACELLGYMRDEFIGLPYVDLIPPEDLAVDPIPFDQLRAGLGVQKERRLRRKDGRMVVLEIRGQMLANGGFLGVARDITDRKRAEESLRLSEAMIQSIFRAAPVGLGVVCNREICEANDRLCEMVGYGRSELVGASARKLYATDEEFEFVGQEKYRQIAERGVGAVETRWVRKDGSSIDVFLSSARIGPLGAHEEVVFAALDITDRKRAEEALKASQRMLEVRARIVETFLTVDDQEMFAEVLDIVLDAMESEYGVFAYIDEDGAAVCPSMTRHVWDRCAVPDKSIRFPPETWGDSLWGRAMREKRPLFRNEPSAVPPGHLPISCSLVVPFVFRDEVIGHFHVANKPGGYDESDVQFLEGIARYIAPVLHARLQRDREEARREQLEAQLRQAQKMEAIGRLAGGVAHDFNNMLSAIIGHAQFALEHAGSTEPLRSDLQHVLTAARRSADLTRQLLAFARRQTAQPRVLNLNEVVSSAVAMLRRLIPEHIDLQWRPSPDLWSVKIDPGQVDQILTNLAVNASDAIEGAGTIRLETANVTLDHAFCARNPGSVPGDYVMLSVSDTGVGMSEEVLANLFEPFFTTKELGKGTGLGLATVYGIVKQNDGYITVQSAPGEGATFRIYLPALKEETTRPAPIPQVQQAARGAETILVVEDEEAVLSVARVVLERQGYTVLTASTPTEALALAERHEGPIHLLVTDVILPEMDGRELHEHLSAARPDILCLYTSGYTADVIARRGILDEGVHFLPKPFVPHDLVNKVRAVLETRPQQ